MNILKKGTIYTIEIEFITDKVINKAKVKLCGCGIGKEYLLDAHLCNNKLVIEGLDLSQLLENTYNANIYAITSNLEEVFVKQTQFKLS